MRIRRATPRDAALLAEVGTETFHDTFAAHNTRDDMALYLASAFGPSIQAREIAEPGTAFLVAEVDGEPAGYARVAWGAAPPCVGGVRPMDIARFYIRRPWIGRCVAAALMESCLEEARRAASDVVWLAVWEHNLRAKAFYRKWAFIEVGHQAFVLGTDPQRDLVLMRAP